MMKFILVLIALVICSTQAEKGARQSRQVKVLPACENVNCDPGTDDCRNCCVQEGASYGVCPLMQHGRKCVCVPHASTS